ncbi:MAG: hypothetical protein F4Y04_01305, partial [Chloroflexi bacterium]|nr:hypothetical protein [Chloroflexota bacterium]
MILVAVVGLLAVSTVAQAQSERPTTTLVTNFPSLSGDLLSDAVQAQSFTTGPNASGYRVDRFDVYLRDVDGRTTTVHIRENNASNEPGDLLATATPFQILLANYSNRWDTTVLNLDPNTTYWLTVNEGVPTNRVAFGLARNGQEGYDPLGLGWEIGDTRLERQIETEDWESTSDPLVIRIRGPFHELVTINPNHPRIGAGLEDLIFTLTRELQVPPFSNPELEVTVTIEQDQSWLDDSDLEHTVTFARNSATTTLTLPASSFSFDPTTEGNLIATVTTPGVLSDPVTVGMISVPYPPVTLAFDRDAYSFAEDADAEDVNIYVVATLDDAYPRVAPIDDIALLLTTVAGTAASPDDFDRISANPFLATDAIEAGSRQVARHLFGEGTQKFAIKDDDIYEGDEQLQVNMALAPGNRPGLLRFRRANGTFCETSCSDIAYPVTITDAGDLPALALSADPASIAEEDDAGTTGTAENVSTVTVSITNAKTFAEDQTVTLGFSGTATYGTHYRVSPADADGETQGHQVVLPAGAASVPVTVISTPNDTAHGERTIGVAGFLDATEFDTAEITITEDDTAVSLSLDPASVSEGASATDIRVTASLVGAALPDGAEVTV